MKKEFMGFVGSSDLMQSVYNVISLSAPSSASIFICGKSGTGKEIAARAIHNLSKRKQANFVAVNCAAIPSDLLESELFGHTKGAFTGANNKHDGLVSTADGGTLFLDELTEMDVGLQAKLLRFIQDGSYKKVGSNNIERANVRFVSAMNVDPMESIKNNKLREDLYYRLNVIPVSLPALRDRSDDAVQLAHYFLKYFTGVENRLISGFTESAEVLIGNYDWPGNVRQLKNVIHSSVVMSAGTRIDSKDIKFSLGASLSNDLKEVGTGVYSIKDSKVELDCIDERKVLPLSFVEKAAIESAIEFCDSNVVQAAGFLKVSPSTLYRKIQGWKVEN